MSIVSLLLPEINGIQNVHQLKKDNKWRLNNRQDLYTHPRYFIWKPVLPQQMYMSAKTSLVPAPMPINYNRYGFPHLAPVHHQSYMFAIPTTKANKYPYQAVKEMGDKRPGIFIINAVMPKPHFPPPTPPTQHLQKAFRKYRTNKQLYHQYLNTHTAAWQNISRIPIISQQQTQAIQQQHIYEPSPTTVISTKSTDALLFTKNPNNIYKDMNVNAFECDRKSTDDFCNILFSNLQNASQHKENTQHQHIRQQDIVLSTVAAASAARSSLKSLRSDTDTYTYTTQKSIFLPTPIVPRNMTTQSTVTASNFVTFLPLKQNDETTSNFRPTHVSLTRNDAQQHSYFTIEDAITKAAPINHVFNHPYEAYRHARKRQQHYVKPQRVIKSDQMTTKNSLLLNFFDDKFYETSETQQIDDYSMLENETPINNFSNRDEYRNRLQSNSTDGNSHKSVKSVNSEQYHYINTTPVNYMQTTKIRTTTVHPNIFEIFTGKDITTKETKQQLPITTTTYVNRADEHEVETTTVIPLTENSSIYTTVAITTTTSENKFKKVHLKRPYHPVLTSGHKYKKSVRALFKPFKNITTTSTSSPTTKKPSHKYQRQYKSKKNKHVKYASPLPSTSSTRSPTTTSTSTTVATTDAETRVQSRTLPTRSSEVKVQLKRTPPTQSLASRPTTTKTRGKNKSRRRNHFTTTAKPTVTTSQTSSLPKIASAVTSQTATTMKKSIRVPNSESRTKHIKNSTTNINEAYGDISFNDSNHSSKSLKLSPIKDSSVPPLPIEIYFKKSHNAKI